MATFDRDDNHRHPIPTWDGAPQGWQKYVEQVRLWQLGENLDVKFSLAARLISRMSGSARRACINMPAADLMPVRGFAGVDDEAGGEIAESVLENLAAGIENVMKKLKENLHPEPLVSRGEALSAFFKSSRYTRRLGMRFTEYNTLFEEGLEKMRTEGVDIRPLEPTLGWFYLQHGALTPERKERVYTALGGEDYTLQDAKKVCLRLFAEIHMHEHRPKPFFQKGGRPAQVHEVGDGHGDEGEEEPWDDDEEGDEESTASHRDVQEVIRDELQGLPQDLQVLQLNLSQQDEERLD